jgi:hypothetical protein
VSLRRGLLRGAAAGAAGTTALNVVTYLDMASRARPASRAPEDTVEKAVNKIHIRIPGDAQARQNRISGMGPLTGLAAGVGVGAVLGVARSRAWQRGYAASTVVATVGALIAGNGPMVVLGVTDPRTWTLGDWVSDVIPHLAYGAVAAGVLRMLDRPASL